MHERTLSSTTIFSGRILTLETQQVELETGQEAYREIVRHHGAACVLVRNPAGEFVLIRQFRKPVEQVMLEVVAGIRDGDETGAACARREVREETGYEIGLLRPLGVIYPTPGYVDERIEAFYAEAVGPRDGQKLDHDERVEPVVLAEQELEDLIRRGHITDGKTLATWALFRAGAGL
jgi:ADP-ribose pyrophosphatase